MIELLICGQNDCESNDEDEQSFYSANLLTAAKGQTSFSSEKSKVTHE